MLQLIQILKYEIWIDSSLARFLLQRCLRSTNFLGNFFFWNLKSEMNNNHNKERFGIILEEYLKQCGGHRRELLKQIGNLNFFKKILKLI
jgi:hypothetical protein